MSNLEDYLKKIGEQKENTELPSKYINNPNIDKICEKYEGWLKKTVHFALPADELYLANALDNFRCNAKDIKEFSLTLKKYEKLPGFCWSGIFLSALINNSKEENFDIILEHLFTNIDYMGYKNIKNIKITGNVGCWAGDTMQKGLLTISGNTRENAGNNLCGGTIIIEGSTEEYAGSLMRTGKIIIKKKAGKYLGVDSKAGEIHVYGKIKNIDLTCEAKVYYKTKLIWPD